MTLPADMPAAAPADPYQRRYEAHQARKRATLLQVMRERHSDRMFGEGPIDDATRTKLLEVVDLCPSSCDRHGVKVQPVESRDDRELLAGLLVGGVGWLHRAPLILLLMADPAAYKGGGEVAYMPYLDAGVVVQQLMLRATDLGLASAYTNPNIRAHNVSHFRATFGHGIFCGAVAVGHRHPESSARNVEIADV